MLKRRITDEFLKTLEHLEYGSMTVSTPDGKSQTFKGPQPGAHGTLHIHDWGTIPIFAVKGDAGFCQAHRDGCWDSDDLTQLLIVGLQNEVALDKYIYGSMLGKIAARLSYFFMQNTMRGSKKNIYAHYDIGNDFYKLWLDPSMTYSSALFKNVGDSLQQAQDNKYDRILERLDAKSGRLLEVGCGWGGFAERAMQNRDFNFKGITISKAQHDYAKERLGEKAKIILEDYRLQSGLFDQIVSIEMFEAVGEKFWPVYFGKLKSLLAEKGKAVIQTITIDDGYFARYRQGGDAIRTFIFPGGMLPSPSRFSEETARAGLKVTDRFAFGQDYAKTLTQWLKTFDEKKAEVLAMGMDESFIRLWRFYLACCIASFTVNRTDVMQMELQHA